MSLQADLIISKEETAHVGERIYEQNLKSLLEPLHTGRVVTIHLPTNDYFLGDSLLEASDNLRMKHPEADRGQVYARKIGEPVMISLRTPRISKR